MSALAHQLSAHPEPVAPAAGSTLQHAIQNLHDASASNDRFFAEFCTFLVQLTNAQNCMIVGGADGALDTVSGQMSSTMYHGHSVEQIVENTFTTPQTNLTITDATARKTLRIIVLADLIDSYEKLFIVLESANETPLAAAMSQERFELTTALFQQLLTARAQPAHMDKDILNTILRPAKAKTKIKSLAVLLTTKLDAEFVCIAPVCEHRINQKLLSASDEIADSLRRQIAITMSEGLEGDTLTSYFQALSGETLAARNLMKTLGGDLSRSIHISQEGEGCVVIIKNAKCPVNPATIQSIAESLATIHLNGILPRLKKAIIELPMLSRLSEPYRVPALTLIPLLGLLIPVPHTVKGNASVVPVQQQVIAAPIAGRLKDVGVEPGDLIVANETILATIDTNELQSEHDSLKTQYASHLTEWKVQRANGDAANARLAKLRAEEISAQIALVTFKLENSNLKSPISGYVQGENQKQNIGIELREGEELFRVVQKESTRVELEIPTHQAARMIDRQDPIFLRLDAYPAKRYPLNDVAFYPVAEFTDDGNIVRGVGFLENSLDKPSQRFISGMEGKVRARTGFQPLIMKILSEPVRKLRIFLGV